MGDGSRKWIDPKAVNQAVKEELRKGDRVRVVSPTSAGTRSERRIGKKLAKAEKIDKNNVVVTGERRLETTVDSFLS